MYTRSRSSGGGPGFGNGRSQMNSGNANSFTAPNPYNPQGGNYTQSAYKPGLIEPSAPFKPSGSPAPQQHQQGMKPRMPQQLQQQMQQQHQQQQQQQQQLQQQQQKQQQQEVSTPTTPRLKPILKQSTLSTVTGGTTANAQQAPIPSPVPPPNNAATKTPISKPNVGVAKTDESAAKNNSESIADPPAAKPTNAGEDSRWTEDDQGKWGDDDQSGCMETEDGQQDRPKWRRFKKVPGNKPNKKLKRQRMNQRLRKAVMPKNAIMVLNEMKAGVQFTVPETQAIMPNSLFLVHAELDGKVYVGQGLSKRLARQNAAENALKCLFLEKMNAAAMRERLDADGDSMMDTTTTGTTTTPTGATGSDEAGQGSMNSDENGDDTAEENDDVPWSCLASFALDKLFIEWQNQGAIVPIPRPGVPCPIKNRPETKPATSKQLPPNAVDIHPVMLLNQMRPGTTYTEVGRVGSPPNIQFTLGVEVNGTTYTGTAKNKKDAKKLAAKEALKALYGLTYPEDVKIDAADGSQ